MSGSLILGVTYIAVWFRFVLFLVLPTPDAGYRLQFIMIQEQWNIAGCEHQVL